MADVKKAKKLLDFKTDAGLAIFDELDNIATELQGINKTFGDVKVAELDKITGDQGYTPVKGKDYFTTGEVNQIINEVEKRIRIPLDGITPKKGKDYFTKDEISNIVNEVVGKIRVPQDGKSIDINEAVALVLEQIKLPEQKDIILDTPEQLVDKLESLQGEDRLDASAIKNLPKNSQGGLVAVTKPLAWYDEGVLLSEYVNKIKLSGAGIQGSLDTDGTLVITVVGGGTATFADELMADSGDHTIFTISHAPATGTLLVINESTGQAIPTSAYSNVGTNVTFGDNQEADGETPVFRARYSY